MLDRKAKIAYLELLKERKRRELKASYFEFFKHFWHTISAEELVLNWHIKYLCDEVQIVAERVIKRLPKEYDLVINVPPGTSKSSIVTVLLQPWLWTRDPSKTVITSSYSADLSLDHSAKSRDVIKSEEYRKLFPEVQIRRDKDNKGHWANTSGGERIATSTAGTITGKHGDIIIQDDSMSPKQAESEAYRKQAHLFTDRTLSVRKKDKRNTPEIQIAQRLHQSDSTGHALKKRKRTKHICLPAEVSDNIKPPELIFNYVDGLLDPVRLSADVIGEMKENLGSYGYAGQFRQEPSPPEGDVWMKQWFSTYNSTEIIGVRRDFKVDSAYTDKVEKNDPSGVLSYAFKDNKIYLVNFTRVWKKFPDFCRFLPEHVRQYGSSGSMIGIEPKASGISIDQELKVRTMLNIYPQHPIKAFGKQQTATDKLSRARACSVHAETGRVLVPEGNPPWLEDFFTELCMFPRADHDETNDTLILAIEECLMKPARGYA
jgi:predicted phage terminase large subunit-like protein